MKIRFLAFSFLLLFSMFFVSSLEDCNYGEEKCISNIYYTCENGQWDIKGKVVGECNVDCLHDGDCSEDNLCENNLCIKNPCFNIFCNDYCEDGIKYTRGTCSSKTGECEYKEDSCGSSCLYKKSCSNNTCLGLDLSERCYNNAWYYNANCSGGEVVYFSKKDCVYGCQGKSFFNQVLSLTDSDTLCRIDSCEKDSDCKNYCSGTTLIKSGECESGKCIFYDSRDYSEECKYKNFFERNWIIIISSILVVGLVVFFVIKRLKPCCKKMFKR